MAAGRSNGILSSREQSSEMNGREKVTPRSTSGAFAKPSLEFWIRCKSMLLDDNLRQDEELNAFI